MAATGDSNPTQEVSQNTSSNKPEIDLQALAERVFKLLKQEARIQQERQTGGNTTQRERPYDR